MTKAWEFWIDRGGTFTDIVARRPDGLLVTHKLLSENPEQYNDAAVAGIKHLLNVPQNAPLPEGGIVAIRMGTTVATNALLERKGEPTLLAITKGFADALRIATQNRPRLFDLNIVLPQPVYADVVEIGERMSANGEVLRALDDTAARASLQRAYDQGLRSVAIVLVHGYRYPDHEQRVAQIASEIGFTQISVSSEVNPLMKLVARGDTTVVDAYLSPIVRRYVAQVRADVPARVPLYFMQSSGGLAEASRFRGKDAILSGPAGGIVGMAKSAAEAGFDKVIGFDMGGTSTDVSHYAGAFERTTETMVAGVRVRAPMMHIHSVAAGGGSICHFDGARFRVGPDSAGAVPGPACYRRGGPLTVTDCNLMVGKLQPEVFPKVFGPSGREALDRDVVVTKFTALAREVAAATGKAMSPAEVAEGFIRIAVENMAKAIKQISVQRGYDASEYTLACFGGAGGQHACLVADALRMTRIIIHPLAGVLSAYGIGLADVRSLRQGAIDAPLDGQSPPRLETAFQALETQVEAELQAQGIVAHNATLIRTVALKYDGTDTSLDVAYGALNEMRAAFETAHQSRFGFVTHEKPLIVESALVEGVGAARVAPPSRVAHNGARATPLRSVTARLAGQGWSVPLYERAQLAPGQSIVGPAIITEATATTVVELGWSSRVDNLANLILERTEALGRAASSTAVDPVMLEVFNNAFTAVAEQMGVALQATSYSVNIKERLDFSCAVFDGDGALIANAPHMPVHLGSIGESVKTIMAAHENDMAPGDAFVLNDPYHGGTHLPDITVVMPVFAPGVARPLFYVAARGHHADIGGITPGSMPPLSTTLDEEGVLLSDVLLMRGGRFREAELRALLGGGAYPARNADQNVGDLKAQVAACVKGAHELLSLVRHYGRDVVCAYMAHVQDNAADAVRRALTRLRSGHFTYAMDSGAQISVRIDVDAAAGRAVVDFDGTSAQTHTNFNAPRAVCRAATLYVFRTLVDDDIPLNDGCMRPIELRIPAGSLLNPKPPAAVVAGNVETSQAIVDALYGALGVVAASQGTMNNFTFGDSGHQYYETVAGGAGAGPTFDGADAVQTHMTNSRLTDIEVLEWRFPVIVERFAIRRGSGGKGRHRGGDGAVREVRFLTPMTAAILSDRRSVPPFGVAGGAPAAVGTNAVRRVDGSTEPLPATAVVEMSPGDSFIIETPGGGGYGKILPS